MSRLRFRVENSWSSSSRPQAAFPLQHASGEARVAVRADAEAAVQQSRVDGGECRGPRRPAPPPDRVSAETSSMRGNVARDRRPARPTRSSPSSATNDRHATSSPRTLATPSTARRALVRQRVNGLQATTSTRQRRRQPSHSAPRRNTTIERVFDVSWRSAIAVHPISDAPAPAVTVEQRGGRGRVHRAVAAMHVLGQHGQDRSPWTPMRFQQSSMRRERRR